MSLLRPFYTHKSDAKTLKRNVPLSRHATVPTAVSDVLSLKQKRCCNTGRVSSREMQSDLWKLMSVWWHVSIIASRWQSYQWTLRTLLQTAAGATCKLTPLRPHITWPCSSYLLVSGDLQQ